MRLDKEEHMLLKHFSDMIKMAYNRSIPVYTNFYGMNHIQLIYDALEEFYGKNIKEGIHYISYGGFESAERKMFCFLPENSVISVSEESFPVECIEISSVNKRFQDNLNHRDYLGTLMGLGITREQLGDILVENNENAVCRAFVFCKKDMAEMIESITRIKHTTVNSKRISFDKSGWQPKWKEITGSVPSYRLDAILSLVTKLSRSRGLELIQSGLVYINGKSCTENAKKLEEGDVLSVRGYGKYVFDKKREVSKKGRYHITVKQYI